MSEAALDPEGRILRAGLFAVPHKAESDRMIVDRRAANALERRLQWCTLPHGSQLALLRLQAGEFLRGSGDDLSNYFWLLRHLEGLRSRTCAGRTFDGSEVADLCADAAGPCVEAGGAAPSASGAKVA